MFIPLRPLAVAAAFGAAVFAGPAAAQTVMARSAPAGEKVEVFLNGKPVGSATADAEGDAKIPVNMSANIGKAEIDANIYVDGCDKTRRVWIVEVGKPAPSEGVCNLKTVAAVFWVRPANTIVVDVSSPIPRVLLVRGSYTPPAPGSESAPAPERILPEGLTVFGGGGFMQTSKHVGMACGNEPECAGDDTGFPLTVGAEYRFNRFLAAEASYIRLPEATTNATGSFYRFDSSQEVNAYVLAGKIGFQTGPARIYGKGGTVYHQSKVVTDQTQEELTVPVEGSEPLVFPGGTQRLEFRTDGWQWMFGAGFEIWASNRLAFYAEFAHGVIKGNDVAGGEAKLDDTFTGLLAGIRVNIFK